LNARGGDDLDEAARAALHRELDTSIAEAATDALIEAGQVIDELRSIR